ncbi:hypothetical protein [Thalassotalea sediminis]|uniref:hypothetical protein n=1 Tax=Thalassotalea sediminis TaxID=1759089 RepID=UPI002572C432|nr:hypothetical protein [Thalassotalea sediminis]
MKGKNLSVGIVGCGWLGLALAKTCIEKSINVVVTTQREESLANACQLGIKGHCLSFPTSGGSDVTYPVFDQQVLVICIPPGLRRGKKDYADNIKNIMAHAKTGGVKKVLLISTTAVYQGYTGQVDETTPLKLDIEKVAILANAEQHALKFSEDSAVFRCGGLVGPHRHPGQFFSPGRMVKGPNSYVNLVHQTDVVNQLMAFITQHLMGGIYNCVSDMQVTKQHFYEVAAKALGKKNPVFDPLSDVDLGKQVIANKIRQETGITFTHDDLVCWASKK